MNLVKLFEYQSRLKERIEKEHPEQPNENRFDKYVLALLVEVGECANEWRGFKFWKVNPQPTEKLLEEYVDGLHLILDLGLLIKAKDYYFEFLEGSCDVTKLFLVLYAKINDFCIYQNYDSWEDVISWYVYLGAALGFTWEEIEQAYLHKNAVNHERQDKGY